MTTTALIEALPRSLLLTDDELLPVLSSSLYPGAKPDSVRLVLGYCRASGLDPMQKPVHLVPMLVATGQKDSKGWDLKEWRDVIMPGIGLYRVQAARTGEHVGTDEPQWGPTIETSLSGVQMRFPEWCSVTVYRSVKGERVGFTAVEYWEENYATKKSDTDAPNAMWKRRPRGQLAKCAEAQALRKAFPELGSQPTADEALIELDSSGAPIPTAAPAPTFTVASKSARAKAEATDATVIEPGEAKALADKVNATLGDPHFDGAPLPPDAAAPLAPIKTPAAATPSGKMAGEGEVAYLRNKAKSAGVDLEALLAEMGGLVLDKLSGEDFEAVKLELRSRS